MAAQPAPGDTTASQKPRRRTALYWLIAISLSAVLLYLALRGVDWRRVWQIVSTARPGYLALVLLTSSLSFFVRALRWRILLTAERALGILPVFAANSAGYLANNFLPARAGEFLRSAMISAHSGLSKTYVLTTALSERIMDALALIAISSLVLVTLPRKPGWLAAVSKPMAAIGLAGALFLLVLPRAEELLTRSLARAPLPARPRARLVEAAGQVLRGIRSLHDLSRFLGFLSLTAVIWSLDAVSAIIAARALGLTLPFPVALLFLTGLGLGSALPSTPGYVGMAQFVAVTILGTFGISRSDALAYSLVTQACGYVLVIFWGLLGMWRSRKWFYNR